MDVKTKSRDQGVLSDGVAPTGILGETFQKENKKQGLDNDVNSYSRRNIFDRSQRPANNTPNVIYV